MIAPKLVVNVGTGEVTEQALTPEEIGEAEALAAQAALDAASEAEATTERSAAASDIAAAANAIIARMDAIIDDPTQTDSTQKVRGIVRDDFARAIKKMARYLKAQAG